MSVECICDCSSGDDKLELTNSMLGNRSPHRFYPGNGHFEIYRVCAVDTMHSGLNQFGAGFGSIELL
jgi:hypothetical protein